MAASSTVSSSNASLSLRWAVLIIAGVWAAAVAMLALSSAVGLPYGMNVWPLGEDRSWGEWMQRSHGLALPRDYWSHHDRNPLNPWWYLAASPLIDAAPWGLYGVRKLIDLLLATTTFVLFDRVLRGEARRISLTLAILVMFWNFSGYREQIIWDFLGAMAVSLAAIAAFVHYIDSGRHSGALALVAAALFLIASASYTLQIGIALTLVGLSFFRCADANATLPMRLADPTPWTEAVSMGAIAATYLAIWYTTSRPTIGYFSPNLSGMAQRLVESLVNLLWHVDYTELLGGTVHHMGMGQFLAALAVIAFGIVIGLARFITAEDIRALTRQAPWVLLAVAGVSLMVFFAEAGNPLWPPGSRARMVQQFVSPALASIALGGIASAAMRWQGARTGLAFFRIGLSIVLATALLVGLEYNRQMVELTATQRQLATQFLAIDTAQKAPHYIILTDYDPQAVWGSDGLSDTTVHLLLDRRNVTLRFVQVQGAPGPEWASFWRLEFLEDDVGIGAARLGVPAPLPYDDVAILRMLNGKLEMPEVLDRQDFAGRQVDWHRSGPLRQRPPDSALCPWRFDFDRARFLESGWSVVEPWPGGGSAVWMAAREATLRTGSSCAGHVRIRARVVGHMSDKILDSLRVSAGGPRAKFVAIKVVPGNGIDMEAVFEAPSTSTLTFTVADTVRPVGGDRDLAVMFQQIVVAPVAP